MLPLPHAPNHPDNPIMTPRDFALRELDGRNLPHWPAKSLKHAKPYAPPADPRDLALAENIVIGVTKNALLLQHLIQYYSGRSLKSLDLVVQKILAIALYQLRFLTRIPASAAVDQAVEQTRRFGESRAAGFVNAVLRKATRDPSPALPERDNATEYARLVLSHPPELFQKLEILFGKTDAHRICEHNQAEPPAIVRLAPTVQPETLAAEGLTIEPHDQPGMYVVSGAKRSVFADWASRGIAQVQDPTAAAVVAHLDARPGQTLLDRCCGLGTKTLQMRELIGETGEIEAIDPAEPRCRALRQLIEQRNIRNIRVHRASFLRDLTMLAEVRFDAALVDVPCSNSGVLARRPEARYFQTPRALESLATLQNEILKDTAPFIKTGGLMVYSTCSIWPEENSERIDAFLRQDSSFNLIQSQTTLPSLEPGANHYRDGGFVALLRRI
jgi:16S rRNA (cytosine967-C5)-methyltransferase